MSQLTFDVLQEFNSSSPAGVYQGKMWKKKTENGYELWWYGKKKKGYHSKNSRILIVKEL